MAVPGLRGLGPVEAPARLGRGVLALGRADLGVALARQEHVRPPGPRRRDLRRQVMTAPFLITGCGRSGTAWAAALFTELGYPCGHEVQFAYDRTAPLTASERSEEHTSELQSLMLISYAVFCLKKKQ